MIFPDLHRLVEPTSIAVIGASEREGSQGKRLFDNIVLHSDFDGALYPVNPAYAEIGGVPCWPSVAQIPAGSIDLALVMVNAALVLDTLAQCADRGIPFAIVMTSGFAETGGAGVVLEQRIAALCRATGLRVYGPNCPGFVNIRSRLGLTFSPAFKDDLNSGPIGLATQGGGLGRNVLQALGHGAGVSLWFSAGNEADLGLPDFVAHMARDPRIRVIAVLMEGIKDGPRLIAALRLAREEGKPVVILKIGRSDYGVLAAQSHTASLAGSADVNSAVFRQYGAVEVNDLHELAATSRLLANGLARGPAAGLCVFTFSGGTAAIAADIVGAAGLALVTLQEATSVRLQGLLPSFASVANPLDTTADILRDEALVEQCLRAVCDDPGVSVLLFPIPMDYGPITLRMAEAMVRVSRETDTAIVPIWMSRRLGSGWQHLEEQGLMPFFSLSDAVGVLGKLLPRRETASAPPLHASRRTTLSEIEGKELLRRAGIAVPAGRLATSAEEAVACANALGFPVVMKVVSADIAHKTEAGGVKLGIDSEAAVRQGFAEIGRSVSAYRPHAHIEGVLVEKMYGDAGVEVLIGVHRDEAFGLVMTFGLGGVLVEVLKDVTHRALPVLPEEAGAMVREIRGHALLQGVRGGAPADVAALEALLVQVSDFAIAMGDRLLELDINPVWVGPAGQGAVPLDALVVTVS
jgi:acyl-CoA synthetase (NDP forming)